jgi:hypothetical protein
VINSLFLKKGNTLRSHEVQIVVTLRLSSYSTNSDRGRSDEDKLEQQARGTKSNKKELNIEQHYDEGTWHLAHSWPTRNAHKILTGKSERTANRGGGGEMLNASGKQKKGRTGYFWFF